LSSRSSERLMDYLPRRPTLDLDIAPVRPQEFRDYLPRPPTFGACFRCKRTVADGATIINGESLCDGCACSHNTTPTHPMSSPVAFPSPFSQRSMWNEGLSPMYGRENQSPLYGRPQQSPAYGHPQQSPVYGHLQQSPHYGPGHSSSQMRWNDWPPQPLQQPHQHPGHQQPHPDWGSSAPPSPSVTPRYAESPTGLSGGVWPDIAPLPFPVDGPTPPSQHFPPLYSQLQTGSSLPSLHGSSQYRHQHQNPHQSIPQTRGPEHMSMSDSGRMDPVRAQSPLSSGYGIPGMQLPSPGPMGTHLPGTSLQPLWTSRPRVPTRPMGNNNHEYSVVPKSHGPRWFVDFLTGQPYVPPDAPLSSERIHLLRRYREKRINRSNTRKIKYECRKVLANKRPRIKGRFASPEEIIALGLCSEPAPPSPEEAGPQPDSTNSTNL